MPSRMIRRALVGVLVPALSIIPATLAAQPAPSAQPARADLIITGARIYTVD